MAYYGYYNGHTEDFYSASHQSSEYDMVYTEPESIQFLPVENHSLDNNEYYGLYVNPSDIKYSVYDPPLSSETKSTISDSISTRELNVPVFKEYSSDPYGGGYDPITTYGHPLSPSDEICYPRSTPLSNVGLSDDSPYGKDDIDKLLTKIPVKVEETDKKSDQETEVLENGGEITGIGAQGEIGEPVDDDLSGDYDYKSGIQTSYGSGLEAMDLCESIFGYWPCLDKIERQQRDNFREICDQESSGDPWKIAADYLFGSPVTYNYENYQHLQNHYRQI